MPYFSLNLAGLWEWLTTHGLRIILILVTAVIARRLAGIFLEKFLRKALSNSLVSARAEAQRRDTVLRIFDRTIAVLVWVMAALMALSEFGIDIGPLLAAVGVAGLALGFGGQYLIRDVISGLFIIFENQYRVGDVVCFDGTCGLVEDISLRMTTLRDLDGTVHHVPHGEIKKVSNLSKVYARVNLDVGVAYDSDMEKVIEVVNRTGRELAEDAKWKEQIIKAPEFLRIDDFAESAIIIKILGETKPLKQWDVTGELRKRLKIAFDRAGISIPYPQRVIHQAGRKS